MRVLIAVLLTLAVAASAFAQDEERPRCDSCGMFWDKSATRAEFTVKVDDETHAHRVESLGCMHDLVHETYGDVKPVELRVLDYATYGTKSERMIDGFDAYYLFGTSKLTGSMAPFIAAFASKDAAKKRQAELGGDVVDFAGMRKKMIEAKGEGQDSGHSGHEGHGAAQGGHSCGGGCC